MPIERHLGSTWASVRGPSDPRALLVWLLEAKFAGVLPGPGPRSTNWRAIAAAAADLPVEIRAVRATGIVGAADPGCGLASPKEGEREAALAAVAEWVAHGRRLGAPMVVLEPGLVTMVGDPPAVDDLGDRALGNGAEARGGLGALEARRNVALDQALDRACRSLHALGRAHPDVRFCLTQSRSLLSVADLRGLTAIFEDLPALDLGYWHDAPLAARRQQILGGAQGEWLERFSNRLCGMTLGDAGPEGLYLPPGAGGVDYRLVASYVLRSGKPLPAAVELDPSVDPGELPGIRSFLEKFGL